MLSIQAFPGIEDTLPLLSPLGRCHGGRKKKNIRKRLGKGKGSRFRMINPWTDPLRPRAETAIRALGGGVLGWGEVADQRGASGGLWLGAIALPLFGSGY